MVIIEMYIEYTVPYIYICIYTLKQLFVKFRNEFDSAIAVSQVNIVIQDACSLS